MRGKGATLCIYTCGRDDMHGLITSTGIGTRMHVSLREEAGRRGLVSLATDCPARFSAGKGRGGRRFLGAITAGCMRPFVPRTNKNEMTTTTGTRRPCPFARLPCLLGLLPLTTLPLLSLALPHSLSSPPSSPPLHPIPSLEVLGRF